jgi:hypothetical protein
MNSRMLGTPVVVVVSSRMTTRQKCCLVFRDLISVSGHHSIRIKAQLDIGPVVFFTTLIQG